MIITFYLKKKKTKIIIIVPKFYMSRKLHKNDLKLIITRLPRVQNF